MVNYHGHTKRCHHAIGEDEEYVLKAIEGGFDTMGFSDHVMLPYFKGDDGVRGSYAERKDYFKSVRKLQKKYADKIEILLGFECEWDPSFYKYYKKLLDTKTCDYLIFGNHFQQMENHHFVSHYDSVDEYLLTYDIYTKQALSSHLFKIMAHPDFFMYRVKSWNNMCERITKDIIKYAIDNDVALELNGGPIFTHNTHVVDGEVVYIYPYRKFWEIVSKYDVKVVIGLDAHNPDAYTSNVHKTLENFAKELNIKVIDRLF